MIATHTLSPQKRVKTKAAIRRHGVGPQGRPRQVSGVVKEGGIGKSVQIITGPGEAGPGTTVSFGGNPIIMTAKVALLFYGSAWNNLSLSPNCSDIEAAVLSILGMRFT